MGMPALTFEPRALKRTPTRSVLRRFVDSRANESKRDGSRSEVWPPGHPRLPILVTILRNMVFERRRFPHSMPRRDWL